MPSISIQMLKNKTTEFNNFFLICSLDSSQIRNLLSYKVGYKEIIILDETRNNK
jgi:hypothetical protein